MTADTVILPSPLLPVTAYDTLREALLGAGAAATIADPAASRAGLAVDDLVRRWAAAAAGADLLVAHSNAGYLAPLVRSSGAVDQRIVFLDAALLPEEGLSALAPPALRERLDAMVGADGVLPPWTRWWSTEVLRTVVPEDLVGPLDRACPRLPVSYFDQTLSAPPGWVAGPNAYLALGDTYSRELDLARSRGWPTDRADGGHLHFLHEPGAVAERVLTLAARLPRPGRPGS